MKSPKKEEVLVLLLFSNTYYVENLNDSGEGSFRWCIEQANSHPGPDTIVFAQNPPD